MKGLTFRSWAWGLGMSLVMCSVNTLLTLKVGLIEEGAVVTFLLFMLGVSWSKKKVTAAEATMVATMGSAGGSLSFIANFFAALQLAGHPLEWWQMALFATTTSLVGLVLAIPMRQLFVVQDPLPWPTGRVAISAIDATVNVEDSMQPRILGFFAAMAFAYVFASGGLGIFPEVIMIGAFGLSAYGASIACSPFLLGAGYLIGMRVGWGFLIGACILIVMAPHLPTEELQAKPHMYIWPGVAALMTCGLTGLLFNWRTILKALASLSPRNFVKVEQRDQVVSGRTLVILLVAVFIFAVTVMRLAFGIPVIMGLTGFLIGAIVFNIIATRAAGETAFNPVRVMGVMLQGVFALMGGSAVATNLTGAGMAAGSIGQTGVLVQDTYFGRYFKVPAKKQVLGQLVVLVPVSLVIAGVYWLVTSTYTLGEKELSAPISVMWSTMAGIFAGTTEWPAFGKQAMIIGAFAGIGLGIFDEIAKHFLGRAAKTAQATNQRLLEIGNDEQAARREIANIRSVWRFWPSRLQVLNFVAKFFIKRARTKAMKTLDRILDIQGDEEAANHEASKIRSVWRFWPHSLGITLAMIIPVYYSTAFFVGAVFLCWVLPKWLKTDDDTLNSMAAAGIVGEGIGGLVVAILLVLGVLG